MWNKKGSVLIYAIVLTTIALLLSVVLLANNAAMINTQKYYKLNTQFFNQIKSNNILNIDYLKKLNSDWSGFIDNYSWSWADIKCRLQADWSYFIEWNSGSISGSDWLDDNCNNDDYLASNSWGLYYTWHLQDDDDLARKQLIWIVVPDQQKNIFWNNKKIEEYIDENPNNYNSFNKTLSWVTNWNLYLDVSTWALLTLIEYDKNRYDKYSEIKEIKSFTWVVSGSWYIKKNPVTKLLELDKNPPPGLEYSFNFSWSWYLLFLTNTGSNLISYNLSWYEKNTWSWIYLNPINDDVSNTWSIQILWYDVIIDKKWEIFGKMLEKVFDK